LAGILKVQQDPDPGSISQGHGSADPDPDPHQNVMDPEHWKILINCSMFEVEEVRGETVELLGRLERLTAAVEQAEREGRQETPPASQANSCSRGADRPGKKISVINSVADPGCLSRILIFTHPGSRILDPKTGTKESVEKHLLSYLFLQPQISQNCELFYFLSAEEKNLGQFSKNYRTFYPKNCH
jgi:hypothetical protein